jgi:sugar phosphate isomerase/epimerase
MQPSLWTSMFFALPAVRQIEELQRAGFSATELAYETILDPDANTLSRPHAEKLRAQCDRLGVATPQVHYPICTLNPEVTRETAGRDILTDFAHASESRREFDLRCAEELLELCPVYGIEVMVVHPGGMQGWGSPAELDRIHQLNVAAFRRLAQAAARHGAIVAIENVARVGNRVCYGADFGQLVRLIDEVGSPHIGVCLDTSHAHIMKVDLPAAIRQVGRRLVATHISDNFGENDDHLFPYGGRIDWPPVVQALKEIGYSRLFNLEIPGERCCPPDVLRLKARYARKLVDLMLG